MNHFLFAQSNLVPNSSFEIFSSCPTSGSQITLAMGWFTVNGTSDYFNACNTGIVGVPSNGFGYQNATTGNGYAGGAAFGSNINYRELISIRLLSTLVAGKKYCVGFYVCLAEASMYAIANMGALLSDTMGNNVTLNTIPQILNPSSQYLVDTVNWVFISGTFIAIGNENYITIGNFYDDNNTDTISVASFGAPAYYYIDDVSVIDCDVIPVDTLFIPNVFTPNYDGVNDVFEITGLTKGDKVQLYNRWGTLVFETESEKAFWDGYTTSGMPCNNGIYFYVVTLQSGETKKGYLTLIK